MSKITLIILIILCCIVLSPAVLIFCKKDTAPKTNISNIPVDNIPVDTVLIRAIIEGNHRDSLSVQNIEFQNRIYFLHKQKDSLKKACDSIRELQLYYSMKIDRIRRRIAICDNNKSQKVFFYGWVKRIVQKRSVEKK